MGCSASREKINNQYYNKQTYRTVQEDAVNGTEQVNSFKFLGNMISYEKELDIDNKLHNYLKITGILNNVFRPPKTP